jgi:hypothetical protein
MYKFVIKVAIAVVIRELGKIYIKKGVRAIDTRLQNKNRKDKEESSIFNEPAIF